jgi:hypothetical protein
MHNPKTFKKIEKVSFLPEIKVNIIFDSNTKKNESDDSENEVSY